MRKVYLFLALTTTFLILTSQVLSPAKPAENKSTIPFTTATIPDDLKVILKKYCMNCHATGRKMMAMAKLIFSNRDSYDVGKQAGKADDICKVISGGILPPKSFRESNPDAIPKAAPKVMICKWIETLAPKE